MYRGRIEFEREDAQSLAKAIEDVKIRDRAKGKVEIKGRRVKIIIEAKDANAFRAALNSYLRIIQATENIGGIR